MKFLTRPLAVLAAAATLTAAAPGSAVPKHPDDKTILHVLNRVGFGARPGDVARVREMGLDKYLDQQLHPERIADTQMTARLERFETLNKSSRDLAIDYYIPVQMAKQQAKKNAANEPAGDGKAPRTPEVRWSRLRPR